jgi:DNA topoisomerase-1
MSRRLISKVIRAVADQLRNTPATCRKYYIHPAIITSVQNGGFHRQMHRARLFSKRNPIRGLADNETAVLWFLKHSGMEFLRV